MSTGLLFDCDEQVGAFAFRTYKFTPFKYDRAIGLLVGGELKGAVLFHSFNGFNVDLSYYGQSTLTAGVVRCIGNFLIQTFNPSRLTVMTSKRNKRLMRSFHRLGFKVEGVQRCFYGARDINRNSAVRFVMFRDTIDEIVGVKTPVTGGKSCS